MLDHKSHMGVRGVHACCLHGGMRVFCDDECIIMSKGERPCHLHS